MEQQIITSKVEQTLGKLLLANMQLETKVELQSQALETALNKVDSLTPKDTDTEPAYE